MNRPHDKDLNKFDWKLVQDMFAIMKPFWTFSGPMQKWFMAFFLTIVGGFTVPVLTTIYAFFTQHQMNPDGSPVLVDGSPVGVTLESLMPGALFWTLASLTALVFLLGFKEKLASGKYKYFYAGTGLASIGLGLCLGFTTPWLIGSALAIGFVAGSHYGVFGKYKYVYAGVSLVLAGFGYHYTNSVEMLPAIGSWLTSVNVDKLHAALPWFYGVVALGAPVFYGWKYRANLKAKERNHLLNLAGIVTGITVPTTYTVYTYLTGGAAVAGTIASVLPWTVFTALVLGFVYGFRFLPAPRGKLDDQGVTTTTKVLKFAFSVLGAFLGYKFLTGILLSVLAIFAGGELSFAGDAISSSALWLMGAVSVLIPFGFAQMTSEHIRSGTNHHRRHLLGIVTGVTIPVLSIVYAFAVSNVDGVFGTIGVEVFVKALSWTAATAGFLAFMHGFARLPFSREHYEKVGNTVVALFKYSKPIYTVGYIIAACVGVYIVTSTDLLTTVANTIMPADGLKLTMAVIFFVAALGVPTGYLMFMKRWMHEGWRLLAILVALMFSVTGFNVLLTYLMRDMWNALRISDADSFWFAIYTVGAIFIVGVFIVVPYRYVRDKLGLQWRLWLSEMLIGKYMSNRNYYKISQMLSVDNPEQRISQDIKAFTGGALAFLLMILDSILVVAAFAVVLYTISPLLTYTVLVYAAVGSLLMAFIGKRLIGLNYRQEELEANFYYQAVHVRNNSEAIAFFSGEEMETKGLLARLGDAIKNYNFVIRWERNMAFFSKGYDYLVVILPLAIVAPLYFAGDASMGEIQQANSAFSQILAAMSLFVTQFTAVTAFAANIKRLKMFEEELDKPDPADSPDRPRIERAHGEDIVVDDLTLMTPNYVRTLIRDLNLRIGKSESILVMGESGSGKSSLLRGIAGLWRSGDGSVTTPDITDMMFMPQKPYLPIGSLRWQIQYPDAKSPATDEEILEVLKEVNLENLIDRFETEGGFDAVLKWDEVLSGGEQQRVAMARLLLAEPKYAIVDEASSALDDQNEEHVYQKLKESGTTYISVGHRKSLLKYHDRVLYLNGDGTWEILDPSDPKVQ